MVTAGLVCLLLSLFLSGCSPTCPDEVRSSGALDIRFLDVGQGHALLLQFPGGGRLLVDTGTDSCGSDTLLEQMGVDTVNRLIITHPHWDHYGNGRTLISRFHVRRVLFSAYTLTHYATGGFYPFIRFVTDTAACDTQWLNTGDTLIGADHVVGTVLWPDSLGCDSLWPGHNRLNTHSLVIRFDWKGHSLLTTGDITGQAEQHLTAQGRLEPADLLQVPHHGADGSTTRGLLDAVHPLTAVISSGADNPFGHPGLETLQRLDRFGCQTWRTDVHGTVRFLWTDAENELIVPERYEK